MTILVDASALVAVMQGEPDADDLTIALEHHQVRLTTGVAMWEAARAVAKKSNQSLSDGLTEVERFCLAFGVVTVPIGAAEASAAARAHDWYGKGVHPAQLNMGDCFAYACARTNDAALLYKGDDFAKTDLA